MTKKELLKEIEMLKKEILHLKNIIEIADLEVIEDEMNEELHKHRLIGDPDEIGSKDGFLRNRAGVVLHVKKGSTQDDLDKLMDCGDKITKYIEKKGIQLDNGPTEKN